MLQVRPNRRPRPRMLRSCPVRRLKHERLDDRVLLASDVLATASESLHFGTQDQSMWGPGTEPLVSAEFDFRQTLLPESAPGSSVGQINLIPNQPALDIYNDAKATAIANCTAALPDSLGLDGNCGVYVIDGVTIPRTTVSNAAAQAAWDTAFSSAKSTCRSRLPDILGLDGNCPSYVINGATLGPFVIPFVGTFGPYTIPRLGPRPSGTTNIGPFTIAGIGQPPEPVRDGAILNVDGALEIGLGGQFEVSPGKVAVDFPTDVTLEVVGESLSPGSVLTIQTSGNAGDATMSTEFSSIDASLSAFLDASFNSSLEIVSLGVTSVDESFAFDTGPSIQELVSLHIETNNFQLEFFDYALPEVALEPFGSNLSYPALPPPYSDLAGFPLADVQLYFPELDTPNLAVGNTTVFDGDQIVNSQLPVTRTGSGETSIDFFKLDLDLDGLFTLPFSPLPPVGIEISTGIAEAEINVADIDFGAFLGIGQTMTFDPTLIAELNFSVPIEVETSPGSGIYEVLSAKTITVGEELNIVHPGGDFQIDPVYHVSQSTFSNDTNIYLSPVITAAFLQVIPGGLLPDLLGISGDYHVYQETFPLGQPIPIGQIGNSTPFVMEGFAPKPASTITVPGESTPPVIASVILGSGDPADDASGWSQAFIDTVDGEGQGAGNGLGYELTAGGRSIPWDDVDRIYIQFSEDVGDVTADQVMLLGGITSDYSDQLSISYDPANTRAIIVSESPLPLDKFRLALSDSISLESSTPLDGDADGSPGGTFDLRFDVVPGDGNNDGQVSIGDIGVFGAAFNSQPGESRYDPFADWNAGDGVSIGDIGTFGANFNQGISGVEEPPEANFGFESQSSGSTENTYAADLLFALLSNSDDSKSSPRGLLTSDLRDDAGLF